MIAAGIDLGTAAFRVATCRPDCAPTPTADAEGSFHTPSALALLPNGQPVLGVRALHSARPLRAPTLLLSLPRSRPELMAHLTGARFTDTSERLRLTLGADELGPEETLGFVLGRLAERLPRATRRVALSVPARWSASARDGLAQAARLARLPGCTLVDSALATAIGWGIGDGHTLTRRGRVLVADISASGVQFGLVELQAGRARLVASAGAELGTRQLDRRIAQHFLEVLQRRHGWPPGESRFFDRLMRAAARAREQLATVSTTTVQLNLPGTRAAPAIPLTRAALLDLGDTLLRTVSGCLKQLLDGSRGRPDWLLLVGGGASSLGVSDLIEGQLGMRAELIDEPSLLAARGLALAATGRLRLELPLAHSVRQASANGSTRLLAARGTRLPLRIELRPERDPIGGGLVHLVEGESPRGEHATQLGLYHCPDELGPLWLEIDQQGLVRVYGAEGEEIPRLLSDYRQADEMTRVRQRIQASTGPRRPDLAVRQRELRTALIQLRSALDHPLLPSREYGHLAPIYRLGMDSLSSQDPEALAELGRYVRQVAQQLLTSLGSGAGNEAPDPFVTRDRSRRRVVRR